MMGVNRNTFLSANWEYLAMFNYVVDPVILKEYLPPYTELDLFNGKALITIVGFLFNNTKVLGVKWPFHINFEEVNLRFYIRHYDGKQWKRGVAFVSEIVPKRIIAGTANLLYNEHYSYAKMNHSVVISEKYLDIQYRWKVRNNPWNHLNVRSHLTPQEILNGSQEEFIFEHYFGYNQYNSNTTIQYTVEHPRWQIYPVVDYAILCDTENLYGKKFIPFIDKVTPESVYLAKGSTVKVGKPSRITSSNIRYEENLPGHLSPEQNIPASIQQSF